MLSWGGTCSGLFKDLAEILGVAIQMPVFVIENGYFIELDVYLFNVFIAQCTAMHGVTHLLSGVLLVCPCDAAIVGLSIRMFFHRPDASLNRVVSAGLDTEEYVQSLAIVTPA